MLMLAASVLGMWQQGCLLALTDKASDAVQMITAGNGT
jgi:hypothetical protein